MESLNLSQSLGLARILHFDVIPAKAGIHISCADPGFRRDDELEFAIHFLNFNS